MKKIQDNFSKQAATYKKYRPTYPQALYEFLLEKVEDRINCWDVGTGNGQVAAALSECFEQVYATDISQKQLDQAISKGNIHYQVARAEQTDFPDQHFDLIVVAQALHWFDFEAFNQEVKRVARRGAILAVWGYALLKISAEIDLQIDHFYRNIIGPYWNEERQYIDEHYRSIPLAFEEMAAPNHLEIQLSWSLTQLEGYLKSWSAVQHYLRQHPKEEHPVDLLMDRLKSLWKEEELKSVRFPIFLRWGIIH